MSGMQYKARPDTADAYNSSAFTASFPKPKKTHLDSSYTRMEAKDVVASEHKVEVCDTIQDCITSLKALYRTKFIFGEHLKFVDSNHASDAYGTFNIPTPGAFDISLARSAAAASSQQQREAKQSQHGATGYSAAEDSLKEKLRTAEELIKKLYKRNTHLEAELRYYKGEVIRLDHTEKKDVVVPPSRPRSQSTPPTRELVRERVGGEGVRVLKREEREDIDSELIKKYGTDTGGTGALRARVTELTIGLVKVQHENEKLNKEKADRVSVRDNLLRQYLAERDEIVATLHGSLQVLLTKINNPLKLSRIKQPSSSVSAAVAAANILKGVNSLLVEQTTKSTQEILSSTHTVVENIPSATRKKELLRRIREISEILPVQKKKELLSAVEEMKTLFTSLASSNRVLVQTYQDLKVRLDADIVKVKMQAAILRDEIKALGLQEAVPQSSSGGP